MTRLPLAGLSRAELFGTACFSRETRRSNFLKGGFSVRFDQCYGDPTQDKPSKRNR
jgi:hypothetical protein